MFRALEQFPGAGRAEPRPNVGEARPAIGRLRVEPLRRWLVRAPFPAWEVHPEVPFALLLGGEGGHLGLK